jgi:exopolyphosphatase/guanosine-5'-triphosphate,3'-diphosphate pyrophosphatase
MEKQMSQRAPSSSAPAASIGTEAEGPQRLADEVEEGVAAFIDIGTNSVRLSIARLTPGQSYSILSRQKETVRLGENAFGDRYLQPEAMRRAALVCRKFAEMARSFDAHEIVATATAATREARNQREFITTLREEAGLEVNVVSGLEEARLIYLGVSTGFHLGNSQALFIDIGGGSTELIVGGQHRYEYLDSFELGAIRLTSIFFAPEETGPVEPDRYSLLQRYVRNATVQSVQKLRKMPIELLIGSSGTIENLADIAVWNEEKRDRTRDDVISRNQLTNVIRMLCELSLAKRREVPGISAGRADIIIGGAAIIETLMAELELEELRISDRGLREGLIVDYLARSNPDLLREMSVRERSVLKLARACNFDEPHARTVVRLALSLFDSGRAAGLHSFGEREREFLEHAALLHDIGKFLSFSEHHAHTYYLIMNADLLGFDQTEIAIIAAVARFHRKGFPSKKHLEYARLDRPSRGIVRTLSIFMRLAEGLDRSRGQLVTRAQFEAIDKRQVALNLVSKQDCELEVWAAEGHFDAFQRVFGRQLVVQTKGEDAENALGL